MGRTVGGGCESGWVRLLSIINAIEAGRQGDSRPAEAGGGGGGGLARGHGVGLLAFGGAYWPLGGVMGKKLNRNHPQN